jgi:hypothetical protein
MVVVLFILRLAYSEPPPLFARPVAQDCSLLQYERGEDSEVMSCSGCPSNKQTHFDEKDPRCPKGPANAGAATEMLTNVSAATRVAVLMAVLISPFFLAIRLPFAAPRLSAPASF